MWVSAMSANTHPGSTWTRRRAMASKSASMCGACTDCHGVRGCAGRAAVDECYARGEAPDWGFSDKQTCNAFLPQYNSETVGLLTTRFGMALGNDLEKQAHVMRPRPNASVAALAPLERRGGCGNFFCVTLFCPTTTIAPLGYSTSEETHNAGERWQQLYGSDRVITTQRTPKGDRGGGTAILLAKHMAQCRRQSGQAGSRITWVRVDVDRDQRMYIVNVYMPHCYRFHEICGGVCKR
eukprot:COSAG02_NODE_615_length_19511_cov_64.132701_9_plen_238_part_00